jgi:hypothetical protein
MTTETIDRKLVFDAPATFFVHPHRVIETAMLSHDDKIVVLRNWKRHLETLRDQHTDDRADAQRLQLDSRLAAVSDALNELHRMH